MITTRDITKEFGRNRALHQVSFEIPSGQVVGLLGLNGAGKTTCIRIITGYLPPTDGRVVVDGIDVDESPLEIRKRIGYLPETPPLYAELTVRDYLLFIARLRGVHAENFNDAFERVVELTGLESVTNFLIRTLSLGYRKRVGIAQALIGDPPVLIFDEPISGLDPRQIVEVRNLMRKLAGKHTILISSHILTEVSRTCDRVLILHEGRIVEDVAGENLDRLEEIFMKTTLRSGK